MSQKTFMTIFCMNENRSLWRKVSFSHEQKYKRMRMHFCKMCIQWGNERRYLMQAIEHSVILVNTCNFLNIALFNFFSFPGPNSNKFNVAYDVNSVMIWLRNNIILMIFTHVIIYMPIIIYIFAQSSSIFCHEEQYSPFLKKIFLKVI